MPSTHKPVARPDAPLAANGRSLSAASAAYLETVDTGRAVEIQVGKRKLHALRSQLYRLAQTRGYQGRSVPGPDGRTVIAWCERKSGR